ncbi:coiled-coil domain-containing protein 125-like isoform X2 [Biomphalaria glabrata]|uniref:Coiled-coil domain-containing protein 125-like isoform X2 n=1 Tax=Biomphalaria glabrata TaxID=6526 RepID=A0A9U8EHT2_BIOGL|nr:coiled-coil domain-containing protein 125-like isoform X2 [Biomphalaria glabrata]
MNPMDKVDKSEDDFFNIICGDLGLGESTRSSNVLKFDRKCYCVNNSHQNACHFNKVQSVFISSPTCASSNPLTDCSCALPGNYATKGNLEAMNSESNSDLEHFPTFADVPYGTSMRQQKKLYEKQVNNLRKLLTINQADGFKTSANNNTASKKDIEEQLLVALQEMDELKIELDACRKRLEAKYKAVAILRKQAENADTELKNTEKKASETSRKLEQELSKLQFELEWRESSFIDSQQTWAERFDRVCQENGNLMSKLEARNEELRRANAHKSALARERDELLALLDVTERQKYEHGKSTTAEEDYGTFTSSELAVLGACKCRVTSPDPCGCAHAAANLRKEVSKLKDELDCSLQRREEANLTVDAYRAAFEEQLSKTRSLSLKLSQIATISSRSTKAKAAIKWLIQVLNDDDYSPPKPIETAIDADKGQTLTSMSLQELVTLLTEMVLDKNEVLAHNKLASQILANKLFKYEQKETEIPKGTYSKSKEGKSKSSKVTPNYKLHLYFKESEEASNLCKAPMETTYQGVLSTEKAECFSLYTSADGSPEIGDHIAQALDDRLTFSHSSLAGAESYLISESSDSNKIEYNDDFNNNDAEVAKLNEVCHSRDNTIQSVSGDITLPENNCNQNESNVQQGLPDELEQNGLVNLAAFKEELEAKQ